MNFKCLLLLLLINISVSAVIRKNKKLDGVLKNIGKRYLPSIQVMSSITVSSDQINLQKWMEEPDDYVASVKLQIAERITHHIRWQSSVRDTGWMNDAKILAALQDDEMTAEICESKAMFNKVTFNNYLKKTRGTFLNVEDDAPYSFEVLATTKDVLKMISRVDVKSQWGYMTTVIWNIDAKLVCIDDKCVYKMFHVGIGGGCTEHGVVNHNYTELGVRKDALEQLEKNTNPDIQSLFDLFTPGPLKFREQVEKQIPYIWLEGMDSDPDFLRAYVCHENETISPRYTKQQFRSWYGRFSQMWHPKEGDKDYLKVQVVDFKTNEIVARITMRLQIGVNENATTHDWNMKVITSFNQHDDQKWYITRVEFLCQPHIKLRDESLLVYRDVVGSTFASYISDVKNWHMAVEFVKRFRKGTVELESCKTKIMEFDDLTKTFVLHKEIWDATIKGYLFPEEFEPLPAKEEITFVMRVTFKNPIQKGKSMFGSEWTFSIRWDDMDQFYYVHKLVFSCPAWMTEGGNWMLTPVNDYIRFG